MTDVLVRLGDWPGADDPLDLSGWIDADPERRRQAAILLRAAHAPFAHPRTPRIRHHPRPGDSAQPEARRSLARAADGEMATASQGTHGEAGDGRVNACGFNFRSQVVLWVASLSALEP